MTLNLTDRVLVLRSTPANRVSKNGFVWPESGPVECPDWEPTKKCGNGLHGLLWGEGNVELLCLSEDAVFQVVSVPTDSIVDLKTKVKFPEGEVIFSGDRFEAGSLISKHAPKGARVTFGRATAGDRGMATAGYRGTATAGDRGTATAGIGGTATAGYRGTATAGDRGTATAGIGGTATAGDWGTATAGDWGTATAGIGGTATAGDWGTATAGDDGTATAGDGGVLVIEFYDGTKYRKRCAEVDGEKIKANVAYRLNDQGEFVEATK